jgi:alanine racemase
VVLFGKQGSDEITQAELEGIAGTVLIDMSTVWGQANPMFLKTGSAAK